jgi:hypothetical protein
VYKWKDADLKIFVWSCRSRGCKMEVGDLKIHPLAYGPQQKESCLGC